MGLPLLIEVCSIAKNAMWRQCLKLPLCVFNRAVGCFSFLLKSVGLGRNFVDYEMLRLRIELNLGKGPATKLDEFSEKCQRGGGAQWANFGL